MGNKKIRLTEVGSSMAKNEKVILHMPEMAYIFVDIVK